MGQVAFNCFVIADQALHFQVPVASRHEFKGGLMAFFSLSVYKQCRVQVTEPS